MKILLLGKNGQVGWELQRSLAPLGDLVAMGRQQADFEQPQALRALVREVAPDVIVNAAAYTAVDKAEAEPERAYLINAASVQLLAEEAKLLSAWLVHYSTDYVFDGEKTSPYREDDAPNPLSIYGKTKLEGEQLLRGHHAKHLIFRTSWIHAARGENFVKTILRLARDRADLKVVADQYGAPTSAELIADATALVLYRLSASVDVAESLAGTYHLAAGGETTWHGFAQSVLQLAQAGGFPLKVAPEDLTPIPTDAYPLPAVRPKNSRMDTTKFANAFGIHLTHWQCQVQRLMMELLTQENR